MHFLHSLRERAGEPAQMADLDLAGCPKSCVGTAEILRSRVESKSQKLLRSGPDTQKKRRLSGCSMNLTLLQALHNCKGFKELKSV